MSPHTPGPWEVVQHSHVDDELWLSVNQQADEHGMKEWVAEIKYLVTDPDRQKANARLIASAPEMLNALKETLAFWTTTRFAECENGCDCVVDVVRAAIAKAEWVAS